MVVIYVAATAVMAFLVFVWPRSPIALIALLLFTFPVSMPLLSAVYIGGSIAFGAGDAPLAWRVLTWIIWTAVALAQALAFAAICRARRNELDA